MTDDEIKKKMVEDFQAKMETEEEYPEWTDEELLATAKRIAKKMGIEYPFYSGENGK